MSAERQHRVSLALREHGPLAPPGLRARIEADLEQANEPRRGVLLNRLAVAGAFAACLAALALILPVIFGGGGTSVNEVHGLSSQGPEGTAPAPKQGDSQLLAADFEGVSFPNWEPKFGWRAIGERHDHLDGRQTETVFYEHEGHVIGYTIVSGNPIDIPAGAEQVSKGGVEVALLQDDHGHDIAVFERGGKTCVLSGHVERRSTLVKLAAWAGEGRVTF
jgi:hypothetical protein